VDEFGYLSVIISVILGLSIAQLLQGISQVINARDRVRMYWPTMAWTVLLLLVDIQAWWAMFGYRNRHAWTFVQFTIVLFEAIMLYLLAAIVLPNIPNEANAKSICAVTISGTLAGSSARSSFSFWTAC
jgi:hypothetical protein